MVIREGSPSGYAVESALMVYQFAGAVSLGFTRAHFDVRKGNESVWKFHERFGGGGVPKKPSWIILFAQS